MSNWKKYRLGEIAMDKGIVDGPFGSNLPASDYTNSGVPVIRGVNLSLGERKFYDEGYIFVSPETAKRLSRSKCVKGDIVFTKKGTLGQIGIIPENARFDEFIISSNQMKLTVDERIADKNYVYYYLSSSAIIDKIKRESESTGVPKINLGYLKNFEILLPDLKSQKRIASILSSLDNKIELNRCMNQTLDQMAATLFKKYFVDDIEASSREISLLETANLLSGGTPKTGVKEFWDGEIAWISAKDVTPNNRSFILDTERKITKKGLDKSAAKLLPTFSTVITARGTVGNICLTPSEMAISQSNYALKSKIIGADFFLFQLVQFKLEELQQNSYGTVFDTITTNTLRELKFQIPSEEKVLELEEEIKPFYKRILSNLKENRILIQVRDSLLPKLMSGEIDISAIHQNEELHAEVLS